MTGKCVICESGHAEWVDTQNKAGLSTREIAKLLEAEFGLSISHVTVASHLNHGDKSDRTEQLEARIRNLEIWVSHTLSAETFLTWIPKMPGGGDAHPQSVSHLNTYLQTIPNPETIESESIAILTCISGRMDKEEAERDRQQKEVWAREKMERDRLAKLARDEQEAAQKKAREEAKRSKIETMRKTVAEYDRNPSNAK